MSDQMTEEELHNNLKTAVKERVQYAHDHNGIETEDKMREYINENLHEIVEGRVVYASDFKGIVHTSGDIAYREVEIEPEGSTPMDYMKAAVYEHSREYVSNHLNQWINAFMHGEDHPDILYVELSNDRQQFEAWKERHGSDNVGLAEDEPIEVRKCQECGETAEKPMDAYR